MENLLSKIGLSAALLGFAGLAGGAFSAHHLQVKKDSISQLKKYDELTEKLSGGNYMDSARLSRENPSKWGSIQADFNELSSLQDSPEIKKYLEIRDSIYRKQGKAVCIQLLGTSMFLGGLAMYSLSSLQKR